MSTHPAYPTLRDLAVQAAAEAIIDADIASAQQMRLALATAAGTIAALKFVTGCPVVGYDIEDVLAGLADMTPPDDNTVRSQIEGDAYDLAHAEQVACDAEAAEYRAQVAQETAP